MNALTQNVLEGFCILIIEKDVENCSRGDRVVALIDDLENGERRQLVGTQSWEMGSEPRGENAITSRQT